LFTEIDILADGIVVGEGAFGAEFEDIEFDGFLEEIVGTFLVASTAVWTVGKPVITITWAGGVRARAFSRISSPEYASGRGTGR
jgi:hypothetical protein